jgi:hypothetical protein
VKGAFLLNFARFVEWPAQAFRTPQDSISICVLGKNPFGAAMEEAASRVTVGTRGVAIRGISDVQQARACHMVFVSSAERKRSRSLLESVHGESVLTVGESEGFIADGGVIELRIENNRVRMEISAEAAKRAGLRISAKLLSLAQAGAPAGGRRQAP